MLGSWVRAPAGSQMITTGSTGEKPVPMRGESLDFGKPQRDHQKLKNANRIDWHFLLEVERIQMLEMAILLDFFLGLLHCLDYRNHSLEMVNQVFRSFVF